MSANNIKEVYMLVKIASCAVLILCAMTAHAADQAYEWSFQGFTGKYSDVHSPDVKIFGTFVVNDLNLDGNYDLSELKSFSYATVGPQPCANVGDITCAVSAFSYDPKGKLTFNYDFSEPRSSSTIYHYINADRFWGHAISYTNDGEDHGYCWDAQTIATVTPVPEPHSYLMLGAGLLALGVSARRRRNGKSAAQQTN